MIAYTSTLFYKTITSFTDLSEASLLQLFEIANMRHLKKGEVIIHQGKICKTIVFVEKGYLRTYFDKDGKEINTNFTFEGNFTTNLKSLTTSTASEANIQANEPSIVFELDKDKLLALYHVSAEIESFGRKVLEQLLIDQEEHTNFFKMYSPTERYQYIEANKPELLQRISLSQLSSYIGIARETLSRIRKNNT